MQQRTKYAACVVAVNVNVFVFLTETLRRQVQLVSLTTPLRITAARRPREGGLSRVRSSLGHTLPHASQLFTILLSLSHSSVTCLPPHNFFSSSSPFWSQCAHLFIGHPFQYHCVSGPVSEAGDTKRDNPSSSHRLVVKAGRSRTVTPVSAVTSCGGAAQTSKQRPPRAGCLPRIWRGESAEGALGGAGTYK